MGYLVLFFIVFFGILAYAPDQATKLFLGLAWMAMIAGILYTVGQALLALAGG